MDSVMTTSVTPKRNRNRFAHKVAKVLHISTVKGILSDDKVQKSTLEKVKDERVSSKSISKWLDSFEKDGEDSHKTAGLEALAYEAFASVASLKAAYAELQCCQSPYDANGIQTADKMIVQEFKRLSEMKQCFVKEQLDFDPGMVKAKAEALEAKSLVKTFEIMCKKSESQMRLKDSEILYLQEKLEEVHQQNKELKKSLTNSGQISIPDNVTPQKLMASHFICNLKHTVNSIRSFVKIMITEMKNADWDLDAATESIIPGVKYWRVDDKCFAFESFVCREMFDSFHFPYFVIPEKKTSHHPNQQMAFFRRFSDLKLENPNDYLCAKPKSTFARFCQAKYLRLIHPKMESSFFGNLKQRNLVMDGGFPETPFFGAFSDMARRVWLLHCLAFSFQPEAAIFQVRNGCQYSEIYMQCVAEESSIPTESDPPVAFTVVPGFRIGKTVIQCQVYLASLRESSHQ